MLVLVFGFSDQSASVTLAGSSGICRVQAPNFTESIVFYRTVAVSFSDSEANSNWDGSLRK